MERTWDVRKKKKESSVTRTCEGEDKKKGIWYWNVAQQSKRFVSFYLRLQRPLHVIKYFVGECQTLTLALNRRVREKQPSPTAVSLPCFLQKIFLQIYAVDPAPEVDKREEFTRWRRLLVLEMPIWMLNRTTTSKSLQRGIFRVANTSLTTMSTQHERRSGS